MSESFIGWDGYPCEFQDSPIGKPLISAMRSLEGGVRFSDDEIRVRAHAFYSASIIGKDEELPRNRQATPKGSVDELRKLSKLTDALLRHIANMRKPAVTALHNQGWDLFALEKQLSLWPEGSLRAISELESDSGRFGAPQKFAAGKVTEMAASFYSQATGREPTIVNGIEINQASGPWLDFLNEVLKALRIKASAESQSKILFGKKGGK